MKNLYFLFLIACIACNSPEPQKVFQRVSSCPNFLLDTIKLIHGNRISHTIYSYDAEDRIIEILQPEENLRFTREYGSGADSIVQKQFLVVRGGEVLHRESRYSFDALKRLIKVQRDFGDYHYSYDASGRVVKVFFNEPGSFTKTLRTRFTWEGDHIQKSEIFDKAGTLLYETYYTYDTECSIYSKTRESLDNPVLQDPNNITKTTFSDHTALLELGCYTCISEYEFNADGLPIRRILDGEIIFEFIYK